MEEVLDNQKNEEILKIDEQEVLQLHSGRKPFVVTTLDPAKDRQQEMAIFTSAKKIAEYVFVITQKSPVKFRWSIVGKLQNTSIELVEVLYSANFASKEKRTEFQRDARVKLKLLDFYTETANKMQAITNKQMFVLSKMLFEAGKLLSGWVKSETSDEKNKKPFKVVGTNWGYKIDLSICNRIKFLYGLQPCWLRSGNNNNANNAYNLNPSGNNNSNNNVNNSCAVRPSLHIAKKYFGFWICL